MDYARQKYWQAIGILVGVGSAQMRLSFAAEYLMSLSDKNFPNNPDLAKRHNEVMKKLNLYATPLSDHDGFLPRQISDDEANVLSREILSIYTDLRGGI
jgi:hypothetical protein